MEVCLNGCGNVFESNELQQILDVLIGVNNNPRKIIKLDIDEPVLYNRIASKVRNKLKRKEQYHENHNR